MVEDIKSDLSGRLCFINLTFPNLKATFRTMYSHHAPNHVRKLEFTDTVSHPGWISCPRLFLQDLPFPMCLEAGEQFIKGTHTCSFWIRGRLESDH